jgi:hypothetical protein
MTNNNGTYNATFSYSEGYAVGRTNDNGGGYSPDATLRRRNMEYTTETSPRNGSLRDYSSSSSSSSPKKHSNVVKKLDFMFPKVDTEFTVRTERGGMASLMAYALVAIFVLAETITWMGQRNSTNTHIVVDTSIGKKMRVNLDITFPSLACEDLHIDIMDIAGDSQLDIEDTMVKKRLNRKGMPLGDAEIVETNLHRQKQSEKEKVKLTEVPDDYCGPCYGAAESESQCCNTCDDLIEAYQHKRWRTDMVVQTSEQCIREGRDKNVEPKRLRRGEGCNLHGHFMVNRVGGNFHIAMGEGIEREGRHIHTFNPDDTQNFNASHIINHLSFGPDVDVGEKYRRDNSAMDGLMSLDGVTKFVTKEHGTTGLFQYFIKIVPTMYMGYGKQGRSDVDTNRYFYTERFRPLLKEILKDDDDYLAESQYVTEEDGKSASVPAGHVGGHAHQNHHSIQKNSILPGVFFIYEIYPFEVEVSKSSVPLTHLLIRIMATVGGVLTIVRWADSWFYARGHQG